MGNLVLNLITALGTIVAACSILTAFILYKQEKLDKFLSGIRFSLQTFKNNMHELDGLLNWELMYEMVYTLLYSKTTQPIMHELFDVCNNCISKKVSKEESEKEIKTALGIWLGSFQCNLAVRYGNLVSEIQRTAIVFYPKFKGLFHFENNSVQILDKDFLLMKKMLLDENLLAQLIFAQLIENENPWTSYTKFQKSFMDSLIYVIEAKRRKSQKHIDVLLELVSLVYKLHIELTDQQWVKLARQDKKIKIIPMDQIGTFTESFREIGKYFQSVMNREQSNLYASLVQRIEDELT